MYAGSVDSDFSADESRPASLITSQPHLISRSVLARLRWCSLPRRYRGVRGRVPLSQPGRGRSRRSAVPCPSAVPRSAATAFASFFALVFRVPGTVTPWSCSVRLAYRPGDHIDHGLLRLSTASLSHGDSLIRPIQDATSRYTLLQRSCPRHFPPAVGYRGRPTDHLATPNMVGPVTAAASTGGATSSSSSQGTATCNPSLIRLLEPASPWPGADRQRLLIRRQCYAHPPPADSTADLPKRYSLVRSRRQR